MRALVQHRYGTSDVLAVEQVSEPVPGPGQVLVRVVASSLNARDWHVMRGEPRVARWLDRSVFERAAPRHRVRGTDFAGIVEAVGPVASAGTRRWRVGDRVFGEAPGAVAELVAVPAEHVAAVPDGVGFAQAAALPLAASTAALCLDAAEAAAGQRLLVVGASGGVGTFAVQLARHRGLHVTGVCSTRNVALVAALGAHEVVDRSREDFARRPERYDVVLDLVGNRPLRHLRRVVDPGGILVLSGGGLPGEGTVLGPLALLARAAVMSKVTATRVAVPRSEPEGARLEQLGELVAAGALSPVVDRSFPLDEAADAMRHLETGRARGKVVICHDPARATSWAADGVTAPGGPGGPARR